MVAERPLEVELICMEAFVEFFVDHDGGRYTGRLVPGIAEYEEARNLCEERKRLQREGRAPMGFAGPPPLTMEISASRVVELGERYPIKPIF